MQLFGVLADAGLTTIVVRELAQRPERAPVLLGSALVLRSGLSLAAVAAAVVASLALPYPPDVRVAVAIAGIPLAFGLLNSAFVAVLQAGLQAGRAAVGDVAGRAASLAAVALVAALDLGFHAVVATAGVGAAVTLLVTARLARRALPARPVADRGEVRGLLLAALPLGAALALNEAYGRADALIISLTRPFDELGLYALGWRVLELSATLPAVLLFALFPLIARFVAQGETERLRTTLQVGVDVLALAGLALAVGGGLVADALARALGGDGFAGAAEPMRVLLVAAALGFVNGLYGHALIARARQLSTLWLNAGILAINVGLNVLLVPKYGIMAAAWSAVACEIAILAASSWLMVRHLAFRPSVAALGPGLIAAAAMAAALWPLRDGPLWLSVPAGALVYVAVLAPLGGVARLRALRSA